MATTIQGNLIGTDVAGTSKIPNTNGIQAIGLNILVGGLAPGARNIISGNRATVFTSAAPVISYRAITSAQISPALWLWVTLAMVSLPVRMR